MSFEKSKETKIEKEERETPARSESFKLMVGLVGRAETLIMAKPDLPAEKFAEILLNDPRNEAKPTEEQKELIRKMTERIANVRHDLLTYVIDVAEKLKINLKEIPKNSLELLETNSAAKLQFLHDLGLLPPIYPEKFKIHLEYPTAIGVECLNFEDYVTLSRYEPNYAAQTAGFFASSEDFALKYKNSVDKNRVKKITDKIFVLNSMHLEKEENRSRTIIHENQHILFNRFFDFSYFSKICHQKEELEEARSFTPRNELGLLEEKIKQLALLEKEFLFVDRIEQRARDEFAAYCKASNYRYDKKHLFTDPQNASLIIEKPTIHWAMTLRAKFDILKKELWRLEAGGVKPQQLYKIFELGENFKTITEELSKIKSEPSAKGFKKLLEDESDVNLLFWLQECKEEYSFDFGQITPEIENWCWRQVMTLSKKEADESDLSLVDKYVIGTQKLTGRIREEFKKARAEIAANYFKNFCGEIAKMDTVAASVAKNVQFNIYNNTEITNIDDRIMLAREIFAEVRPLYEKFNLIISEINHYDKNTAEMFKGDLNDLKDGHKLSLREKIKEAENEFNDLKKVKTNLKKLLGEFFKIDKIALINFFQEKNWKDLPIRDRYNETKKLFESLSKKK